MSKKIAVIGECMIELSEKNGAVNRGFGGDTLNTSVYIARQTDASALSVHYVTALGTDAFSQQMLDSWQQENVRETERKRAHRSLMTRIRRKNCFAGKKITEVVKKLVDNYRSACYNSFIFDCFTMVEW